MRRVKVAIKDPSGRTLGIMAVMVGVVVAGFTGILVKLISLQGLPLSFYRVAVALAVTLIGLRAKGRAISWQVLRRSAYAGIIYAGQTVLYVTSFKLTSVADVALISTLQPVLALVLVGRWFGEEVSPLKLLLTIAAILGASLVLLSSLGTPAWHPVGDLLAFGSVIGYTIFWLLVKRARTDFNTFEYMSGVLIMALLVIAFLVLITHADLSIAPGNWILLLLISVPWASAALLMAWAQRYIDASLSAVLIVAVPLVAIPAAYVILGERVRLLEIPGALLLMAAVAALVRDNARGRSPDDPK